MLCCLCRRFCHLLVVVVVAVIVVIFVIVVVVVAMAAVARAGARARGEQRRQQQQQQCRALGVCRIPPGTVEIILRAEEEERRLLGDAVVECGAVVGVWGDYGFLRSASRPEDGGVLPCLSCCFCLHGGWGGGRCQAGRRWRRWGGSAGPGPEDAGGSTPALEAKEGVRPSRWSSESWSQVRTPHDRSLQVGVEVLLVRFCIHAAAVRRRGESDKRGPNSCGCGWALSNSNSNSIL